MVIERIAKDPALAGLAERLKQRGGVVGATGLWGSSAPLAAAQLHLALNRPTLYLTSHLEDADDAFEDLEFFLDRRCAMLPAFETLPGEGAGAGEIEAERIKLCVELLRAGRGFLTSDIRSPLDRKAEQGSGFRVQDSGDRRQSKIQNQQSEVPHQPEIGHRQSELFVVAPIQAVMQPLPTPAALAANTLSLQVGRRGEPDELAAWLIDRGFARLDRVEAPGDFARRGDIVDVFAPGETNPARVVFLDDHVESIRRFDVSSQRSLETQHQLAITAVQAAKPDRLHEVTDLFDYLAPDTWIVLDGPVEVQEMGHIFWDRLGRPDRIYDVHAVLRRLNRFDQLYINRIGGLALPREDTFHFAVSSLARFEGKSKEVLSELGATAEQHDVYVVCENDAQRQRLGELIQEVVGRQPDRLHTPLGMVHRGFEWTAARTLVLGHHQLFGRHLQRRRMRRAHASRPLDSWLELEPGDYVVHSLHGIARFREMKTLTKEGTSKQEEFLTLEFDENGVLHVPVSQIDLVQKYVGVAGVKPKLSKLGGSRWKNTKDKVSQAVTDLAESLLRIQAARQAKGGTAYPADTTWQQEFEAAFEYDETEDQLEANIQIKRDLSAPLAMDRLLCGDVGFGKTELAMRAAFKVVEYGRQVAVLVPTTVLAEQHFRSFSERFAEYPFTLGCLSRFRSLKEQKQLIEQARKGQVDILIGTHRLLSKDVHFSNLGLVVIDEEQRFGVEHKEKLKQFRETIEVLTLTATPIPRTLHMSMIGLRDISSLATPPVDRRSIATQVRMFDRDLVRSATLREMNRDGQVFFLHNHVRSIQAMAAKISEIVPEARVRVGHGQMAEGELAKVMGAFVRHEADVLVATTIIESGIDIPRANTIFIHRADRLGLADLHQLRGRVGRSHHRAYCYVLLEGDKPITDKAARRLKAIEEFSELGAGFRIAMRDLEIRGAGNILGPEQSGHIASVGYEMYCQLLERAVRHIKGEPDPTPSPVHLELNVVAQAPKYYIASARARIDFYRRLAACHTSGDIKQLENDLTDMYGPYPEEVSQLIQLAELRVMARKWKIHSIVLHLPDLLFKTEEIAFSEPLFAGMPGTVRTADGRTIHVRLPPRYLETGTMLAVLRKHLSRDPGKTEVMVENRK